MSLVNNEIHLKTFEEKMKEARSLVHQYCGGKDLLADLLKLRKEEREKDNGNV